MAFVASNTRKFSTLAEYRHAAAQSLEQLLLIHGSPHAVRAGIVVIGTIRNELPQLSAFLRHYRRIGASGFMLVDNGSTDGSTQFLRAQDDVVLFTTSGSYALANQGGLWLDGLADRFLSGRWCVRADADEFLVFHGMDRGLTLAGLAELLETRGELRLLAPLLDMYPAEAIEDAALFGDDPFTRIRLYDGQEQIVRTDRGYQVIGGVRARLFAGMAKDPPWLNKYPFALYDRETAFIHVHYPVPFGRNFLPIFGRLLHLKFHQHLRDKISAALKERQHSCGSAEYQALSDALAGTGRSLRTPASLVYDGPESLIASGHMAPVPRTGRLRSLLDRWSFAARPGLVPGR